MPQHATPELELGINCIMHGVILFAALTLLFMVLIAKVSTNAMNTEVKKAISTNLGKALDAQNLKTNGELKRLMKRMDPALATYEVTVSRDDEATVLFNEGLYMNAYLILGVFVTALVVMLCVMRWGADIADTGRVFLVVLLGNAVTFSVIGAVEYTFFDKVARKYCPTKPSVITEGIVRSVKAQF